MAINKQAARSAGKERLAALTYPLEQQLIKNFIQHVHCKGALTQDGVTDNAVAVMVALAEWLAFPPQADSAVRRHLQQQPAYRARDLPSLKEAWWRAAGRRLLGDPTADPGRVADALAAAVPLQCCTAPAPSQCFTITTATFDLGSLPWQVLEAHVFPHLTLRDRCAMRLVSRSWGEAVAVTVDELRFPSAGVPAEYVLWRWPSVTSIRFRPACSGTLRGLTALPPPSTFDGIRSLHLPLASVTSDRAWGTLCRYIRKLPSLRRLALEVCEPDLTAGRGGGRGLASAAAAGPLTGAGAGGGRGSPPGSSGGSGSGSGGNEQHRSARLQALAFSLAACPGLQLDLRLVQGSGTHLPPLPLGLAGLARCLVRLERSTFPAMAWQTDDTSERLAPQLTRLTALDIHNCQFTSARGPAFLARLPATSLLDLDLGRERAVGSRRAMLALAPVLAAALRHLTRLTSLDLSGYRLATGFARGGAAAEGPAAGRDAWGAVAAAAAAAAMGGGGPSGVASGGGGGGLGGSAALGGGEEGEEDEDEGLREMASALAGLTALRRLKLSHVRAESPFGSRAYWHGMDPGQARAASSALGALTGLAHLELDEVPFTARMHDVITDNLTQLTHLSWARAELADDLSRLPRRVLRGFLLLPRLAHLDLGSGRAWNSPWALHSTGAVAGVIDLLQGCPGSLERLLLPGMEPRPGGGGPGPDFEFQGRKVPPASSCALSLMLARAVAARPELAERPVHQGGRPVYHALRGAVQALYEEHYAERYHS